MRVADERANVLKHSRENNVGGGRQAVWDVGLVVAMESVPPSHSRVSWLCVVCGSKKRERERVEEASSDEKEEEERELNERRGDKERERETQSPLVQEEKRRVRTRSSLSSFFFDAFFLKLL